MSELSYDGDDADIANANDSMRVSMRALIRAVKTARDTHKHAIEIMEALQCHRENSQYALTSEDNYELRCLQDDIDDVKNTLSMLSTLSKSLT